jgi:phospholipase D1/2
MQPHYAPQHNLSVLGSIRSRISQLCGWDNASRPAGQEMEGNTSASVGRGLDHAARSSSSSLDTTPTRPPTPMLDPSTNANPLLPSDENPGDDPVNNPDAKSLKQKKKRTNDVSKHTFYVENSQTRLKLVARNEVPYHPSVHLLSLTLLSSARCCNG